MVVNKNTYMAVVFLIITMAMLSGCSKLTREGSQQRNIEEVGLIEGTYFLRASARIVRSIHGGDDWTEFGSYPLRGCIDELGLATNCFVELAIRNASNQYDYDVSLRFEAYDSGMSLPASSASSRDLSVSHLETKKVYLPFMVEEGHCLNYSPASEKNRHCDIDEDYFVRVLRIDATSIRKGGGKGEGQISVYYEFPGHGPGRTKILTLGQTTPKELLKPKVTRNGSSYRLNWCYESDELCGRYVANKYCKDEVEGYHHAVFWDKEKINGGSTFHLGEGVRESTEECAKNYCYQFRKVECVDIVPREFKR